MLARFAEAVRPEPRPPDPDRQALEALVVRHQQLVEIRTMERNRRARIEPRFRGQLEEHRVWLDRQVDQLDQELDDLLRSAKGVGPILSATLLALLPELGHLDHRAIAALVGVAPFSCDSGRAQGKRVIWGGARLQCSTYSSVGRAQTCWSLSTWTPMSKRRTTGQAL